ncbi:MgtC/SapB family protein [Chryseobacterium sp. MYb264]|uniref:MgtC/SapB family protein n=1 Tax=Chryseobacterium sp. MYb264 TaxID=2745153 RepID=UPI002E147760|nr:MgtC/SapB family protein [Chryseobacterium sp. MYb264]
MSTLEFTNRLFIAFILGAVIGFERQWHQKSAGLRTNTLVCLGSAAFILLSIKIGDGATGRVASYIVSGIGFLGGGAIMKDGLTVRGLNTAATIWCSASVGALAALGLFPEAAVISGFIVLTHTFLRPLGMKIGSQTLRINTTEYLIRIKCKTEIENHTRALLMQSFNSTDKILLKSLASEDSENPEHIIISAELYASSPQDSFIEKTISRLTLEDKILKASWEIIGTENDL